MEPPSVELVEVDDAVLRDLVDVAIRDSHPNEVTPPLSPGETWTEARIEWLRSYHATRRGGLSAATPGAGWAIRADGSIVGGARLQRVPGSGRVEAGIWLCRSARQRGIGRPTMAALIDRAVQAGAHEICAETTEGNLAAVAILGGLGFDLVAVDAAPSRLPGRAGGRPLRARRTLPPPGEARS